MYTYSRSIKGDSSNFTQQQSIFLYKAKLRPYMIVIVNLCVYADIAVKPAYIRDCELKTHIQEEKCIKIEANRQDETNFTPIRHYQANMLPDLTQK